MMLKVTYLLILIPVLFSCGPSTKEIAERTRQREDSIRIATEEAVRLRVERKHALEDSIATHEAQIEGLRNRMILRTGDLEAAKDKMITIKGYQFLRTADEREVQVREQTILIKNLEIELNDMGHKIFSMQEGVDKWKLELIQLTN